MGRHLCQPSQDSEEIDFEDITLAEIRNLGDRQDLIMESNCVTRSRANGVEVCGTLTSLVEQSDLHRARMTFAEDFLAKDQLDVGSRRRSTMHGPTDLCDMTLSDDSAFLPTVRAEEEEKCGDLEAKIPKWQPYLQSIQGTA